MDSLERDKIGGLKPGVPDAMNERARNLLSEFERIVPSKQEQGSASGPWLFGLPSPSALDAHLVVFVARMRDVGRAGIIPDKVSEYADRAMARPEWQGVMEGRKTMVAEE